MAQPTRSSTKPAATASSAHGHAAPARPSAPTPGLHYNQDDLHADYQQTFSVFMKMLAVGVFGAVAYFFVMIIYLGAFGHTPTDDYVREFGSRIQYDYKGLRMPEYDDPSILAPKPDAKPAAKEAH